MLDSVCSPQVILVDREEINSSTRSSRAVHRFLSVVLVSMCEAAAADGYVPT